jgi:hypothetical protein
MIQLSKGIPALFAALVVSAQVHAQIVSPPSITALQVQVSCQGLQPYVSFVLPVLPGDRGRSAVVYVGMRDQGASAAMFLQGGSWEPFQGGLFPVYTVITTGLVDQRITLPLNGYLAGGGWMLYAGYGALSDTDEVRVRDYSEIVAKAEQLGQKKTASVTPDHYRRTLMQNDMVKVGKYSYINTGVENNSKVCQPDNEGN